MQKLNNIFNINLLVIFFLLFYCTQNEGTTSESKTSTLSGRVGEQPSPGNMQEVKPAKKLALLVGINKYKSIGIKNLKGCVNDVEIIKTLLIGKFDFQEQNIKTLTNQQATRNAIIQAFQHHLVTGAAPDAIVVFHFSGHGSQMDDVSGDEIDNLDETIVPYDSRDRGNKVFDINDDELNGLFQLLSKKTKNITFIFDSCHSGSIVRGAEATRSIHRDKRQPPAPDSFALSTRGIETGKNELKAKNVNYALISGCRPDEESREYSAAGKKYGALTYFLTQELKKKRAAATYRDIMDNVTGLVSAAYPAQHPTLDGALLDQYVFGETSDIAQPYILASPTGEKTVILHAGKVQGLTAESIFDIYKPGTKHFAAPEKPIAKVKLIKTDAVTAIGEIFYGSKIPESSRAIERQHNYEAMKMFVHLQNLKKSPTLQTIKTELKEYKYIETVAEASGYDLLLRQEDNEIITEGRDPTEISPRVRVSDTDVVEHLMKRLTEWAKWFNIHAISNAAPAFEINFTIKPIDKKESSIAGAQESEIGNIFIDGEQFQCVVENRSKKGLYISILDISSDGSIAVLHPEPPGAIEKLAPGDTLTQAFETYVPEDRKSVIDILKVFATEEPLDFRFLSQESIRGTQEQNIERGKDDPLYQLLTHAGLGTIRGAKKVKLQNWAEARQVIKVQKNLTDR